MRLHGLEIPVADMDRAFGFYTQVLGFPVVGRRGNESAMLFLGNVHDGMVTLARRDAPTGEGTRFLLGTDESIEAVRARLEAAGVALEGPARELGVGEALYFRDSEGNPLAIIRPSGPRRLQELRAMPLQRQAADLDLLETRLREALTGMGEREAREPPAAGEWTVVDQVGHITETLRTGSAIVTALASGRQPPRGGLLEVAYPSESFEAAGEALWAAFAEARACLSSLPAEPDASATHGHGVFGPLDWRGWVAFILFHAGMHLNQITAIKASAG